MKALTDEWILIAAVGVVVVLGLAVVRWRERRWIAKRRPGASPLNIGFGVKFFGLDSERGVTRAVAGFLVLFPELLLFRARFSRLELAIDVRDLTAVTHGSRHREAELGLDALKIEFRRPDGRRETAAFAVPFPIQWEKALRAVIRKG